ncbi:MAG: hypothetical protein ACJAQ9_003056, partial [Ilumatobacter sp.]
MSTLLPVNGVGLGLTLLTNFCTTVYLYRALSHRA